MWQGCILSPKLFNLYTEKIFNESDELPGCVVGGENINYLRYADDTVLLVESESTLQSIMDVVRQNSEEMGLSMNVKKTKTKDERCVDLTEITFRDQKTSGKMLCTFHFLYASESWTLDKQMED